MSSWNMPPGVTTNMIPGNRPEDIAEEEFWDKLAEKLLDAKVKRITATLPSGSTQSILIDDCWDDTDFVKVIQTARDLGYQHGSNEGSADAEAGIAAMEEDIASQLYDWLQTRPHASAKQLLRKMAEIRTHVRMRAD